MRSKLAIGRPFAATSPRLLIALLLSSLTALTALSACNSQDATVTSNSPASGAAPTTVQTEQNVERVAQNGDTQSTATIQRSLFFSMISTDFQGTPVSPAGVAFLASSARTRRAFEFSFDDGDVAFDSDIFVSTNKGVLYAARVNPTDTALALFDPRTRQTQSLGIISGTRITSLSALDSSTFAWTDSTGAAWVTFSGLGSGGETKLALNGLIAADIQLNGTTHDILVSGALQSIPTFAVFSAGNPSTPLLQQGGLSPAESADGTKLIYVQDTSTGSKIAIHDNTANSTRLVDAGGLVRELRWQDGSGAFTYRLMTSDHAALHRIDTTTGDDTALVALHLSSAQAADDHVVCPAWINADEFYFSDVLNSRFSIYRAVRTGQTWSVSLFASPDDELTGYICPQRSGS